MKLTTSRGATVATIFTAILVTASLCSIIIMQTNNASASNVIYKQKIRGDQLLRKKHSGKEIYLQTLSAKGFTTTAGDKQLCVSVRESDPDESDTVFQGCGPAQRLTIACLGTATFGGTITGFDFTTGEEKTVTVNAKLTATGKAETSKFIPILIIETLMKCSTSDGTIRPASGSLNIAGGITFSSDDASGIISKFATGTIQVTKN